MRYSAHDVLYFLETEEYNDVLDEFKSALAREWRKRCVNHEIIDQISH